MRRKTTLDHGKIRDRSVKLPTIMQTKMHQAGRQDYGRQD
jgi:hypothetical protein